jgi:hypothetical protein
LNYHSLALLVFSCDLFARPSAISTFTCLAPAARFTSRAPDATEASASTKATSHIALNEHEQLWVSRRNNNISSSACKTTKSRVASVSAITSPSTIAAVTAFSAVLCKGKSIQRTIGMVGLCSIKR